MTPWAGVSLRALAFAGLLVALPATAQTYAGTYTAKNERGQSVTLALEQDAAGSVAGTLSGSGATLQVYGEVTEDGLLGMVTGGGTRLYILAEHDGEKLTVVLAEPNAIGLPNLQKARELVFTRVRPRPGAPGGPADRGDAPAARSRH